MSTSKQIQFRASIEDQNTAQTEGPTHTHTTHRETKLDKRLHNAGANPDTRRAVTSLSGRFN